MTRRTASTDRKSTPRKTFTGIEADGVSARVDGALISVARLLGRHAARELHDTTKSESPASRPDRGTPDAPDQENAE